MVDTTAEWRSIDPWQQSIFIGQILLHPIKSSMAQSSYHPQRYTSDTQLNSDTEQNEREATELPDRQPSAERDVNGSVGGSRRTTSGRLAAVKTFWGRHVVATVPHEACRDHFGMLISHNFRLSKLLSSHVTS